MKQLFSTEILLGIIILMGFYWTFFDDETSEERFLRSNSMPIGISDSFNQEALQQLGLDLTENLDPKLIPELMTEAIRETVRENVKEKDFLPTVVTRISNRIRDISTIDLNEDGIADPILVVPNAENSGTDYLVFSILVPDPAEVTTLPPTSNQDAWRDIVENRSIEIMTASAVRSSEDQMTMQSTPNPQMYQSGGAPYPPYYQTGPSMTSIFLTSMAASMMTNWLFMPSYGYGFYGNYSPMPVSGVAQNRSAAASSYGRAKSTSTAATSKGGTSVAGNRFRSTSTKSMNQIKSTRYRSANRKGSAGGFGRTRSGGKSTAVRRPVPRSTRRMMRTMTRRRSFGGFGRGGFGGFGRRR